MGRERNREVSSCSESSDDEHLKKWVKKLKKKIKEKKEKKARRISKRRERRDRRHSSSPSESIDTQSDGSRNSSSSCSREASPLQDASNVLGNESQSTSTKPPSQTVDTVDLEETLLSEEVKNVIGKRICRERILGPTIHSDFVARWEDIIKHGLPEKEKTVLVEKYPPPKNCVLIDPPKLNMQIKAAVHESVLKRDVRIMQKQQKITACIAAAGKALSFMIDRPEIEANIPVLECVGEMCSLLTDSQHDESVIQKSLIMANINSSLRDALVATTADEYLFSEKLDDVIKSAKEIANTSKNLKTAPKNQFNKSSKNWKTPLRQHPKEVPATSGGQKRYHGSQKKSAAQPYPKSRPKKDQEYRKRR